MICVFDEVMIAFAVSELEPLAQAVLDSLVWLCTLNSDPILLMVQLMSGLAERCRQRRLPLVADCLLQQIEYVSQQVNHTTIS